jgi:hypothetical protein
MLGICIGICTGITYIATRNEDLIYITLLFLVFNFLNLIPLSVLDGGRFINAVFFTRYPKIELVFNIFTMLAVICVALIFKDIFFGIFAFLIFIPLRALYGVSSISAEIKKQIDCDNNCSANMIQEKYIRKIVEMLKNKIPLEQQNPKLFAINILRIWQKVCTKFPSILPTILLLLLYIFCLTISFCSFTIFDSIVSVITQK